MTILVGDIGGTNARLALYGKGVIRLKQTFPSRDFTSMGLIISRYLERLEQPPLRDKAGERPRRCCLGVAGPVSGNRATGTNLPWDVDGNALSRELGFESVTVINDFEAVGWSLDVLLPEDLVKIGGGNAVEGGTRAVLGAGTGLGEAIVVACTSGESMVLATEGGHCDFAPTDPLQERLLKELQRLHGQVSVERILSGKGIEHIYRLLAQEASWAKLLEGAGDPAAAITSAALSGDDPIALNALNLFCRVYGSEAGNLALKSMATGGVFVAGGIAPRIRTLMEAGGFREAFEAKGRMSPLMKRIPVWLIVHPDPGLLGAGFRGTRLAQ